MVYIFVVTIVTIRCNHHHYHRRRHHCHHRNHHYHHRHSHNYRHHHHHHHHHHRECSEIFFELLSTASLFKCRNHHILQILPPLAFSPTTRNAKTSIHSSIHPSIHPYIHPSIHPSIHDTPWWWSLEETAVVIIMVIVVTMDIICSMLLSFIISHAYVMIYDALWCDLFDSSLFVFFTSCKSYCYKS